MQVQLIYIHVLNLDTLGVLSTSTIIPNLSYGQCFLKLNIHNKYTCMYMQKLLENDKCMPMYDIICVHVCFFRMYQLIIANLYMWCTDKLKKKQITVYKGRKIHVCIHFHIAITLKKKTYHTHILFFIKYIFFSYCHSGRCCIKNVKMT